jgi:hypothetical protein
VTFGSSSAGNALGASIGMSGPGYVSTACRLEAHGECQNRPVVECACPCHAGSQVQVRTPLPADVRWSRTS